MNSRAWRFKNRRDSDRLRKALFFDSRQLASFAGKSSYSATNLAYSGAGGAAYCLQSAIENVKTCPDRAKRVEWIEKTPFSQQLVKIISTAQTAVFEADEYSSGEHD